MKQSALERAFQAVWRTIASDEVEPQREFVFHPTRKWRLDFAWPAERVAVELDGATYTGGRHVTGSGYAKDCEKANAAAGLDWAILRYTSDMWRKDPEGIINEIRAVLARRRYRP